jgi:hypothetical protein
MAPPEPGLAALLAEVLDLALELAAARHCEQPTDASMEETAAELLRSILARPPA